MAGTPLPLYRNYNSSDDTFYNGYKAHQPLPDAETLGWSRDGYVMTEWNSNRDGTGDSYAVGISPVVDGPISATALYAIWELDTINYLTTNKELISIANAIRAKGGTSAQLSFPTEFVSAIQAIQTGITPTGTKQITLTDNGTATEDVTNYASAQITIAIPVYNGEIVTPAYNVTISLTNPVNASYFNNCTIYKALSSDNFDNLDKIGEIESASGSTVVTISDFFGLNVYLDGMSVGNPTISCTGGVSYIGNDFNYGTWLFQVTGDGTITLDGIDYDN